MGLRARETCPKGKAGVRIIGQYVYESALWESACVGECVVAIDSFPVFAALGWSPAGSKRIAIVRCDRQRPVNGSGLTDRTVLIDGRRWFCTAVDRDAGAKGPLLPRERIYLWVRDSAGV